MSRREYGVLACGRYILDMRGHDGRHHRPLTRWQAKKLARRLGGAAIRGRSL